VCPGVSALPLVWRISLNHYASLARSLSRWRAEGVRRVARACGPRIRAVGWLSLDARAARRRAL
jgi:hypothetical protein